MNMHATQRPDGNIARDLRSAVRLAFLMVAICTPLGGCAFGCAPPVTDAGVSTGAVVINEFMASNQTSATDEFGEADDWVELYNRSAEAVDLSAYALSDDIAAPTKFRFPAGAVIEPGGFVIVWTDDDAAQGPLHASFKLSKDGEEVVLSDGDEVVDHVTFGPQCGDVSYGRAPDGDGEFSFLADSTAGAANTDPDPDGCDPELPPDDAGTPVDAVAARINEVLLENATGVEDETGAREPWIELFNASSTDDLDLGGHFLTDDPDLPSRWSIPAGTTLPAGGFLLIFADGDVIDGTLHTAFSLGTEAGELALFSPGGTLIDSIAYAASAGPDLSQGRSPDGQGAFVDLAAPTPEAANDEPANLDGGLVDAGGEDAGTSDAGVGDAGADDAGAEDAGAEDAGAEDAGAGDAGATDAGTEDAGDAGATDAGDGGM